MMLAVQRAIAGAAVLLLALSSFAEAETARRQKKPIPKPEQAAPATPVDKRDRAVVAPGTPFNGKAYWQGAPRGGGARFPVGPGPARAPARAPAGQTGAAAPPRGPPPTRG